MVTSGRIQTTGASATSRRILTKGACYIWTSWVMVKDTQSEEERPVVFIPYFFPFYNDISYAPSQL